MRIGIVGTSQQGRRRAQALRAFPDDRLTAVASAHFERADAFTREFGGAPVCDWQALVRADHVDVVFVCSPPDSHAEIVLAALDAGKHVLCEKPLTRTLTEGAALVAAARESGRLLKCGFNHRYHPALAAAHREVAAGTIGRLSHIRCRYGICGRPGYDKEWRMDGAKVGGGHLMEHGIHAIDLFRWFLGDLAAAAGMVAAYVVRAGGLEDNAFALFRGSEGTVAQLHSSLTQWRNLFSFEVFGRDGYLIVEGLGGSYGTERLVHGRRLFDRPFEQETREFRGEDVSWKEEWRDLRDAILEGGTPMGTAEDGLEAIRLVRAVYECDRTGRWSTG